MNKVAPVFDISVYYYDFKLYLTTMKLQESGLKFIYIYIKISAQGEFNV